MTSAASLVSASSFCACSFKPARSAGRVHRQRRLTVSAQAGHESERRRALVAGVALAASIPLLLSGSANAFVGNTAKDFTEKVNRYTPSPSDIQDVVSTKVEQATPDVPLPGLNQKGKEAEAIGKAPAQSGPGAADQVKGALEDVKPKGGFFDRINAEALTDNAPSVQIGK